MRFDDKGYLEQYYDSGKFPNIHTPLIELLRDVSVKTTVDLGCCHGLLSKQLLERGIARQGVIGIEGNERYLESRVHDDRIHYFNGYVTEENLTKISGLLDLWGVNLVVARRVFPEISDINLELVRNFVRICHLQKVEYIAIEGRVKTKRAVNILSDVDKEVAVFEGLYAVVNSYKNCRLLKRIP